MFRRLRDLDVHVQIAGPQEAEILLFLHSLGTSLHVWDAQAESLSVHFRVVRPDLRGHGLTSVPVGPYCSDEMARDALALLDELGVSQAHVAGLSIGGLIAQSLAVQAPARVSSLILCDTAMVIPPTELWHQRAAIARREGPESLVEAVLSRWVTASFQERQRLRDYGRCCAGPHRMDMPGQQKPSRPQTSRSPRLGYQFRH
jgi:pimeloyl-ACP methyl ester carboxylesterase